MTGPAISALCLAAATRSDTGGYLRVSMEMIKDRNSWLTTANGRGDRCADKHYTRFGKYRSFRSRQK